MLNFFSNQEFFIERIWFFHGESHYLGNGYMTWNPEQGFHLAARVFEKKPTSQDEDIGVVSIERSPFLRIKLQNGSFAFAPNARLSKIQLAFGGHISIQLRRLFFIEKSDHIKASDFWSGSGLIQTHSNITFPDSVTSETKIGNWRPSHKFSRSGLHYEDDFGQRVVGELRDKKDFRVSWSLPMSKWPKNSAVRFAPSLELALSMLAGEIVQLRYREENRNGRRITEMQAQAETNTLGVAMRPFDRGVLNKEELIILTNFLASNNNESIICRQIFHQMADASQQNTRQGSELLMATVLEAIFRSLYNQPFSPEKNKRNDPFSLESSLKLFRDSYLSPDAETGRKWKKIINSVIEAQRRLRDRNAHPDWLSTPGGAYSPEELKRSTNDLIRLSRFYGYVILALAGIKIQEPIFPAMIENWTPLIRVSRQPEIPEDTE